MNKYTQEQINKVKAMLTIGYTQAEIAEITGMSRGNVYRINITYVNADANRCERVKYKKRMNESETKENKTKSWWEKIKEAKYVKVDGEKCKVIQATEHHITFLKGAFNRCINRIDLYDDPGLMEVI